MPVERNLKCRISVMVTRQVVDLETQDRYLDSVPFMHVESDGKTAPRHGAIDSVRRNYKYS